MKRTVLIIITVCLAALFAWLAINRTVLSLSTETKKSARTVIPSVDGDTGPNDGQKTAMTEYDETKQQPLIVLGEDESFIQAISVDLNRDGTQDQICAIKKTSEPNVYLIPSLQNPVTGEFTRLQALRTGITQTRTLLFYCLDIVGDRSNALVCSGMTADNVQLLVVYLPVLETDGKTGFTPVADLRSDGPISIQEVARPDAYNLGLTAGESYPIITYNSDPDSPDTLNQIERVYRWDRGLKRYELASESRITGKKIETQMMRKLQGGNVRSFEGFLDGLWYIPSSGPKDLPRSIYFNSDAKEVIFHTGSTEEIFVKESGSTRRFGVFMITRNRSIESIRRFIDVELTGPDEIRVSIKEDVRLKIGVASNWDGVYRKMGETGSPQESASDFTAKKLLALIGQGSSEWTSPDGQTLGFANQTYAMSRPAGIDSGVYAIIEVGGKPVLQCKPDRAGAKSTFFLVNAEPNTGAGGARPRLTLTEVAVSMGGTNFVGAPPTTFERIR